MIYFTSKEFRPAAATTAAAAAAELPRRALSPVGSLKRLRLTSVSQVAFLLYMSTPSSPPDGPQKAARND